MEGNGTRSNSLDPNSEPGGSHSLRGDSYLTRRFPRKPPLALALCLASPLFLSSLPPLYIFIERSGALRSASYARRETRPSDKISSRRARRASGTKCFPRREEF